MKRIILAAFVAALVPALLDAHCDSLGGPVVVDAREALKSGRVEVVLKWVKPADEAQVRAAFAQALAVRGGGAAARELADRWFFETVVRLHRLSEGEPFNGLRPPDWKPPHVLEAADAAVASGSVKELEAALTAELRERFRRTMQAKERASASVEAGRAYVAAYTEFMHFVELLEHAEETKH